MTSAMEHAEEIPLHWDLVYVLGLVFAVVGGVDLFTQIFPARVGVIEWEFGAASSFFDTVPSFGLGLGFLLAAGLARGHRWRVRALALGCILLALIMWMAAGLFATVVPQTIGAAPTLVALTAVKKSVAKTAVQILVYPVALLWIGVWSWRRTVSRHKSG